MTTNRGFFFFSSRRRHTRCSRDWSSDVCSSDLAKWPEGKTSKNGAKPPGPPATGLPVALRKRQLEMLPTTITPQASVLGETGGQSVKRWPRSKYNAITHGIFGPVVLEGRESPKEYDRLVRSLREYWQPVGAQEELLVGQLATYYWRLRRVFPAAEGGGLPGKDTRPVGNERGQRNQATPNTT